MISLLRKLLRIRVGVSSAQAVLRAKEDCELRGLPWREPVSCHERLRHYVIASPGTGQRGGVVFVHVSITDGEILGFWHMLS